MPLPKRPASALSALGGGRSLRPPQGPPVFRPQSTPPLQAKAAPLQRKPVAVPPVFAARGAPVVGHGPGRMAPIQRTVADARAYGVAVEGTNDLSLIHRVEPASHSTGTVQVYLTVFAYSDSKYKDVHASGTGIKLIAKTHDTMMNLGDPRRAFHYVNTYMAQGAKCPIIRSFRIPRSLYDSITGNAISESQRKALGRDRPYNVDKERGQNQFGIAPSDRNEIERLGQGLVSYAPAEYLEEMRKKPENGTVRDLDELRKQLGMPTAGRGYLAPMKGTHVLSPLQEAEHGALLTRAYDDLDVLIGLREQRFPTLNQEMKIHRNCFKSGGGGYYGDAIAPRIRAENVAKLTTPALIALRDEIGRAATFSVIPQMVVEEYHQANANLHKQNLDKRGNALSTWAGAQHYQVLKPPKAKVKVKTRVTPSTVTAVVPSSPVPSAAADDDVPFFNIFDTKD